MADQENPETPHDPEVPNSSVQFAEDVEEQKDQDSVFGSAYNSLSPEMQGFTAANKDKAIDHRKENMIVIGSTWSTTIEQIGEYGVGMELYFYFLRDIAILFFIISLISIYPMISNRTGDHLDSEGENSFLDFYTLANQEGLEVGEEVLGDSEDMLDELDKRQLDLVG